MGIPALPFSNFSQKMPRPKPKSYPKILNTIGDHIRAWRLDNNKTQAYVAKILGVCEDSVTSWEVRGTKPSAKQIQLISNILRYNPGV
jgi:DNA-binding transcriptional regulator YiaG